MRKRVVITGLGAITPVGNTVNASWSSVLNGISGAGKITHYDASGDKVQIAAEVKEFDPSAILGRKESRRMDRFSQLALTAVLEAKEQAKLEITPKNENRIGAIIGSGLGGISTQQSQWNVLETKGPSKISPFFIPMLMNNAVSGNVAIALGIKGPNMSIATACATGTNAIGEAADVIRRGQSDIMFAGGADAVIIPIVIGGFTSMTALNTENHAPIKASRPFNLDRAGFLLGEGAGICILESLESALERGAPILAELSGYGSTNDAFHISAPATKGVGAVRCMNQALEDSNIDKSKIDYINAHGTSTKLNDLNETLAIKTVFGDKAYSIPVSSTKSMTGHLLGAAGGVEAVFCTKAILDQVAPPTINYDMPDPECDLDYVPNHKRNIQINHTMSNSFGFGGHNATIIISKYQEVNQ
jgi:3-oxoacyl-[acyl-carrier-protein] synthase II